MDKIELTTGRIDLSAAKAKLPEYVESITEPCTKAGKDKYYCPICKSGTGKNRTGAFTLYRDTNSWYCFSCHNGGDIFNLMDLVEGEDKLLNQLFRLSILTNDRSVLDGYKEYEKEKRSDVELAESVKGKQSSKSDISNSPADSQQMTIQAADLEEPAKGRYLEYINVCHAAISETDYFNNRGFNEEIINRFNLGYDAAKGAVVIPYDKSGSYYITRSISEKIFRKPPAGEAGPEPIFNRSALNDNKPCFVCESPIDAISIMAVNENCNGVAIGGTGSEKLINAVKKKRPGCILILSFDNDDPGRKATEKAAEKLTAENIDFIIAEYLADAPKDANEMLTTDKSQLTADIYTNIARAAAHQEEIKTRKIEQLNTTRANNLLADFIETDGLDTPCIETGFNLFDYEMDGGLYPGLYVLGAVSSMGKTSFMLQLADQLAAGKNDVLYFSLEMGAHELIAKSLSRYSYIEANKNADDAVYTRTITNIERRAEMTLNQRINYDKALDAYYSEVSNNLWYFESIGDIGIDEIKARIKNHVEITGRAPLVFIDYLQILKPINELWTEKRNTDKAVLELRKLAREYNTTFFVISSLNRSSYKGDISMDAFKESGAIEYGSDVLLGLQPRGMAAGSYKKDEKNNIELIENAKASENRELELKVLKNRTGRTGQRINLEYNAKFNYFVETSADNSNEWETVKGFNDAF